MKLNTYVMAIDIEMSGSTLRDPEEKDGPKIHRAPEGDIIGIGACVRFWNEETGEFEIAKDEYGKEATLLLPMFRPCNEFSKDPGHRGTLSATKIADSYMMMWVYVNGEGSNFATDSAETEGYSQDCLIYPHDPHDFTVFEDRCWSGFWSKHPDKLLELEYKGYLCKADMEKEAISILNQFRAKWEVFSASKKAKLVVVSDNVSFDIGMIDQLMRRYFPDRRPNIYKASDNTKYNGGNPCTHSMQRGLLAAVDPNWLLCETKDSDSKWMRWLDIDYDGEIPPQATRSFAERIRYLYQIPKHELEHDHNPMNDAYTISGEYGAIMLISHGYYTLKKYRIMKKRLIRRKHDERSTKKSK